MKGRMDRQSSLYTYLFVGLTLKMCYFIFKNVGLTLKAMVLHEKSGTNAESIEQILKMRDLHENSGTNTLRKGLTLKVLD